MIISEEKNKHSLENTSFRDGIIFIRSDGYIKKVNETAKKLLKLHSPEVFEQKIELVLPEKYVSAIKQAFNSEATIIYKEELDGSSLQHKFNCIFDLDNYTYVLWLIEDITGIQNILKKIDSLQEGEILLKEIINSTQDAISVSDSEGKVVLVNRAYTKLTGLNEEDIINKPATVDIAEGESMHLKVVKTNQPVKGVSMKVGLHKKEVLVDVAPIIISGQLKGSVGVVHDITEIRRLTRELDQVKRELYYLNFKYTFQDIVAESTLMKLAVKLAHKAAETSATVLLRGESGTGKELFAHAIHNEGIRSKGKLVRVNCAAIPDSLLESELFGYAEGAFTGAKKGGKAGLFEEAKGGTIFLDEIGSMDIHMQSKLLRVLQEKEIRRVGDNTTVPVDVRIVAATNVDLEKAVDNRKFRKDLYYRLNVLPIMLPSLRQRKEDIPELTRIFVNKYNYEYGRNVERVSPEALKILLKYSWPGNVRELENIIARAMINLQKMDTVINETALPLLSKEKGSYRMAMERDDFCIVDLFSDEDKCLAELMKEREKEILLNILRKCGGNKTQAALKLGIAIRTLYYKLELHGLLEN